MYQEPTIDSTVHTNITVYETTQNIQVAKVIFSVSLFRIQVVYIHPFRDIQRAKVILEYVSRIHPLKV